MNLWVKVGIWFSGIVIGLASVLAGFLLWQNRAENRRIMENYGEKYMDMLKDFSKASKRL